MMDGYKISYVSSDGENESTFFSNPVSNMYLCKTSVNEIICMMFSIEPISYRVILELYSEEFRIWLYRKFGICLFTKYEKSLDEEFRIYKKLSNEEFGIWMRQEYETYYLFTIEEELEKYAEWELLRSVP